MSPLASDLSPLAALLVAVLSALLVALLTPMLLQRLAEPAPGTPDVETKAPYRSLATVDFALACGALTAAAVLVAWARLPIAVQPLWLVLATVGVILVAIDAVTTWIPRRPTHIAWLAMVIATGGCRLLGMESATIIRIGVGAAGCWLLYFLLSLPRSGIGFGDVRLAPLIGAVTAATSWAQWMAAVFLGALIGGVFGLTRLIRKRTGPLPYGPSMLLGAYCSILLS